MASNNIFSLPKNHKLPPAPQPISRILRFFFLKKIFSFLINLTKSSAGYSPQFLVLKTIFQFFLNLTDSSIK